MSVPIKLASFLAALAATFGFAFALGAAFDPTDDAPPTPVENPVDHGGHS